MKIAVVGIPDEDLHHRIPLAEKLVKLNKLTSFINHKTTNATDEMIKASSKHRVQMIKEMTDEQLTKIKPDIENLQNVLTTCNNEIKTELDKRKAQKKN